MMNALLILLNVILDTFLSSLSFSLYFLSFGVSLAKS